MNHIIIFFYLNLLIIVRTSSHINKVNLKNTEDEEKKENRGIDWSFVRSSSIYLTRSPSHLFLLLSLVNT